MIGSAIDLNSDLKKNKWLGLSMYNDFPYPRKQAPKVISSRKLKKGAHPPLTFNNNKNDALQDRKLCNPILGLS